MSKTHGDTELCLIAVAIDSRMPASAIIEWCNYFDLPSQEFGITAHDLQSHN